MRQNRVLMVLCFVSALAVAQPVCGQGWSGSGNVSDADVERILEQSQFPWYDSSTGDANLAHEFKTLPRARTSERASVRKWVQPKQAPTQVTRRRVNSGSTWNLWPETTWVRVLLSLGIVVILAGLLAVVVYLVMKLDDRKTQGRDAEKSSDIVATPERIEQLPFDVPEGRRSFQAIAEDARQRGDYKTATMYLFSHVLLALDQRDLLRLRRGKTNRQYLGELKSGKGHRFTGFFRPLMNCFEEAFFGDHDIDRKRFEALWNELGPFHSSLQLEPEAR